MGSRAPHSLGTRHRMAIANQSEQARALVPSANSLVSLRGGEDSAQLQRAGRPLRLRLGTPDRAAPRWHPLPPNARLTAARAGRRRGPGRCTAPPRWPAGAGCAATGAACGASAATPGCDGWVGEGWVDERSGEEAGRRHGGRAPPAAMPSALVQPRWRSQPSSRTCVHQGTRGAGCAWLGAAWLGAASAALHGRSGEEPGPESTRTVTSQPALASHPSCAAPSSRSDGPRCAWEAWSKAGSGRRPGWLAACARRAQLAGTRGQARALAGSAGARARLGGPGGHQGVAVALEQRDEVVGRVDVLRWAVMGRGREPAWSRHGMRDCGPAA